MRIPSLQGPWGFWVVDPCSGLRRGRGDRAGCTVPFPTAASPSAYFGKEKEEVSLSSGLSSGGGESPGHNGIPLCLWGGRDNLLAFPHVSLLPVPWGTGSWRGGTPRHMSVDIHYPSLGTHQPPLSLGQLGQWQLHPEAGAVLRLLGTAVWVREAGGSRGKGPRWVTAQRGESGQGRAAQPEGRGSPGEGPWQTPFGPC